MSAPHSIRLHGPWLARLIDESGNPGEQRKVRMPTTWSDAFGPNFNGSVRLERSFGRPTGIGDESVWLVIVGLAQDSTVELNSQVHRIVDGRIEITRLMELRNQLRLDLSGGNLFDEVRLEIT